MQEALIGTAWGHVVKIGEMLFQSHFSSPMVVSEGDVRSPMMVSAKEMSCLQWWCHPRRCQVSNGVSQRDVMSPMVSVKEMSCLQWCQSRRCKVSNGVSQGDVMSPMVSVKEMACLQWCQSRRWHVSNGVSEGNSVSSFPLNVNLEELGSMGFKSECLNGSLLQLAFVYSLTVVSYYVLIVQDCNIF